jgi:hypothetical protein
VAVGVYTSPLQPLHEFGIECDESDRHGISFPTRIGRAHGLRVSARSGDPKPVPGDKE